MSERFRNDDFWRFEKAGWDKAAEHYVSGWMDLTRSFASALIEATGIRPGGRLLDICCGPGYASEAASRLGVETVGVDFSAQMVELASERNRDLVFREGDAHELPFETGSFDAAVMGFGLHHLSDPDRASSEAARVLSPGGGFAFTLWAPLEHNPGARAIDDAIGAHAVMDAGGPQAPPTARFTDPGACREALTEAGFEAESFRFDHVTVDWKVESVDAVFRAELRAGVRTAALLVAQTPETQKRIRDELAVRLEPFAEGSIYAIPMCACLIAARTVQPGA